MHVVAQTIGGKIVISLYTNEETARREFLLAESWAPASYRGPADSPWQYAYFKAPVKECAL